jgi:hypothetical protein
MGETRRVREIYEFRLKLMRGNCNWLTAITVFRYSELRNHNPNLHFDSSIITLISNFSYATPNSRPLALSIMPGRGDRPISNGAVTSAWRSDFGPIKILLEIGGRLQRSEWTESSFRVAFSDECLLYLQLSLPSRQGTQN